MNKNFEYCAHQGRLVNQGIHWCEKQLKDYPNCCNKDCPYYEAIKSTLTCTEESLYEINKTRKETNKKRKKTN